MSDWAEPDGYRGRTIDVLAGLLTLPTALHGPFRKFAAKTVAEQYRGVRRVFELDTVMYREPTDPLLTPKDPENGEPEEDAFTAILHQMIERWLPRSRGGAAHSGEALGLSVDLWSHPGQPDFVLVRVLSDVGELGHVTREHLGLENYSYRSDETSDVDGAYGVTETQWRERVTAWLALPEDAEATVWEYDMSSALQGLLEDVEFFDEVATQLFQHPGTWLGLADSDAARTVLRSPLTTPMTEERRAVVWQDVVESEKRAARIRQSGKPLYPTGP